MRGFSWWEELKQIFGSNFKFALTFIILDRLLLFSFVLSLLYCFIYIDNDKFPLIPLSFPMIAFGLNYYCDRKIRLNKNLKGSRYEKTIKKPIGIILGIVVLVIWLIGFIKFNEEFRTQPIKKAINNFGYNVKAPSYISFKPTRQYGWVDKKINQLEISYQKGISTELDIYVTPKIPFDKRGEKLVLYGKNIGYFLKEDDETKLNWKRGRLYFSLIYGSQSTPTKKEILKIVNSMK